MRCENISFGIWRSRKNKFVFLLALILFSSFSSRRKKLDFLSLAAAFDPMQPSPIDHICSWWEKACLRRPWKPRKAWLDLGVRFKLTLDNKSVKFYIGKIVVVLEEERALIFLAWAEPELLKLSPNKLASFKSCCMNAHGKPLLNSWLKLMFGIGSGSS